MQEEEEESEEGEEYFFEEETKNKNKNEVTTFNPKCRCADLKCPRHSNCRECQAFHNKRMELTYCGK